MPDAWSNSPYRVSDRFATTQQFKMSFEKGGEIVSRPESLSKTDDEKIVPPLKDNVLFSLNPAGATISGNDRYEVPRDSFIDNVAVH